MRKHLLFVIVLLTTTISTAQVSYLDDFPDFEVTDIHGVKHTLHEKFNENKEVIIFNMDARAPWSWVLSEKRIFERFKEMEWVEVFVNVMGNIEGTEYLFGEGDSPGDFVTGSNLIYCYNSPEIKEAYGNRHMWVKILRPGMYEINYGVLAYEIDIPTLVRRCSYPCGMPCISDDDVTIDVNCSEVIVSVNSWDDNPGEVYISVNGMMHQVVESPEPNIEFKPIKRQAGEELEIHIRTEHLIGSVNKTIPAYKEVTKDELALEMTTDKYSSELSWQWKAESGVIVSQMDKGSLSGVVEDYREVLIMPMENHCYTLEIVDSAKDGMIGMEDGTSSWAISEKDGTVLYQSESNFLEGISEQVWYAGEVTSDFLPENDELQLYPNPAKDMVNIVFPESMDGNATVQLMDMQGRQITQDIAVLQSGQTSVDVSDLSEGYYLLSFVVNNQTFRKSFVVAK